MCLLWGGGLLSISDKLHFSKTHDPFLFLTCAMYNRRVELHVNKGSLLNSSRSALAVTFAHKNHQSEENR